MQAQRAALNFTEAEKRLGERLLETAVEIDRVEGYSRPHAVPIAGMAEELGLRVGLHGIDLSSLKFAALAHDIGERTMKRDYLLRPDAITWEETIDLWRHPILGEKAALDLGLPRHSQLLIRWHHEWWNGLGYPDGLMGESIPIGARILRVVDSYYALRSNRPYRNGFDDVDVLQALTDRAGIEFDPRIVKLLLVVLEEMRRNRSQEQPLLLPGQDAFTILTPEGLQTAVIQTGSEDISQGNQDMEFVRQVEDTTERSESSEFQTEFYSYQGASEQGEDGKNATLSDEPDNQTNKD